MLEPHPDSMGGVTWEQLGHGAPTIMALAHLCGRAMAGGVPDASSLGDEARAILYVGRERGVFEIKGTNNAFESASRLLSVHVELDEHRHYRFRSREDPSITIRFFEGFRQLCAAGLVMHQLYHEFSLTAAGYQVARRIDPAEVEALVALGQEVGPGAV